MSRDTKCCNQGEENEDWDLIFARVYSDITDYLGESRFSAVVWSRLYCVLGETWWNKLPKAHFKKVGIGFIIIGFNHGIYREGGEELWGHAAWVQNAPWAAILWTLPVSRAASWRGRGLKAACLLEDHNMEVVGSPSCCVHCPWRLSPCCVDKMMSHLEGMTVVGVKV